MNAKSVANAIREAKRLMELAKLLSDEQFCSGGKLTGAARRASMDLTRALAEMRRPS